jgi:hypothetical protein
MKAGEFEVIESFAIRSKNEFYMLGQLLNGRIEPGWFVIVPFNSSLGMTVQISAIEPEVEITGNKEKYMLLIAQKPVCEDENDDVFFDLLLGLNIGLEIIDVVDEGND